MKWLQEWKKNKRPCSLASESGQGIVEYILVLVITVAIILGFMWQFSDTFRTWANNYFGEYLACLLETGEIPSIGGLGGGSGICNQAFEPFTFTAGRPPKNGEGGASGGGGGSGSEKSGGSGDEKVAYASRVGGGGSGSSTSRFRANSMSDSAGGGSSSGGSTKAKEDKAYTGSTDSSMPGSIYTQQDGPRVVKMKTVDRGFAFQREKEEKEKASSGIAVKAPKDQTGSRSERMLVKRNTASKEEDIPDSEMSFGDYLRFLIIAAIIIALVVFIGGQALQVGKSMD